MTDYLVYLSSLLAHGRSNHLPTTLWRVQHDNSQADFDVDSNLSAQIFTDGDMDEETFKVGLENHLRWSRLSEPSFMISTFNDKQRAVHWGRQRHTKHGSAHVCLWKIVVKDLVGVKALPVADLVKVLGLKTELEVSQDWVILNWIPFSAIFFESDLVEEIKIEQEEEDKQAELERELERLMI